MTEIYLIRHTQAEGNLYRIMQGHWDGGVTEMGWKQIDALAERFKDIKIDAVYSSDLYRTRMTAGAVLRHHDVPFETSREFREINMGSWETKFFGDVSYNYPEEMHKFIFDSENWQVEDSETFMQVQERAFKELMRVIEKHPGQSIAIVSHGVTIRCLLSKVTGISLSDVSRLPISRNTAVSKIIYDNGSFSAEYYNDHSHLLSLGIDDWHKTPDLRHESFNPADNKDFYVSCYADAWQNAHGSLAGFDAEHYYKSALEHYAKDNDAVLAIYDKEKLAGIIDLDTVKGEHAGYGWLSFIYLKPEYRGNSCGIQVLARALTKYSELGRRALRLNVAESNKIALAFYRKNGFEELSYETTERGKLLLMEKKLGRPE